MRRFDRAPAVALGTGSLRAACRDFSVCGILKCSSGVVLEHLAALLSARSRSSLRILGVLVRLVSTRCGCGSVPPVDGGTRSFWLLVIALLAASLFFAFGAESRRRQVQTSDTSLVTGDVVTLIEVIDGDTVLVAKGDDRIAVRILGIKALESTAPKDPMAQFGQRSILELRRLLADKSIRVLLNNPPQDAHGRTLAELFVDDQNVALELVRQGLVLVYTVYPFASMSMYLQEQAHSRAERAGLWASPEAAKRATLLSQEWSKHGE